MTYSQIKLTDIQISCRTCVDTSDQLSDICWTLQIRTYAVGHMLDTSDQLWDYVGHFRSAVGRMSDISDQLSDICWTFQISCGDYVGHFRSAVGRMSDTSDQLPDVCWTLQISCRTSDQLSDVYWTLQISCGTMLDTSDQLSDVCCWEDADGASQLAEPPAVRLTVMHLDDVTCGQHITYQL